MTLAEAKVPPQTHLSTGQLLVTREPQIVVTVLGSCVSVTMFEPGSGLAAICHAMLARPRPVEVLRPGDPARYRYVDHAIPAMLAAYRRAGLDRRRIEVKLFGGGNVIGSSDLEFVGNGVGADNVALARALLEDANLVINAENTGGAWGRKILFNTGTGEVLHKRLRRAHR